MNMDSEHDDPPDKPKKEHSVEKSSNDSTGGILNIGESSMKQDVNSNTIGCEIPGSSRDIEEGNISELMEEDIKLKVKISSSENIEDEEEQSEARPSEIVVDDDENRDCGAEGDKAKEVTSQDSSQSCVQDGREKPSGEEFELRSEIEHVEIEKSCDRVKITKFFEKKEKSKMKRSKRSYRKQVLDEDEEAEKEHDSSSEKMEMDIGDEKTGSKTKEDLDVESLENCKISEKASSSEKSDGSNLKRSKCKSQRSSAKHKKRKKTVSKEKEQGSQTGSGDVDDSLETQNSENVDELINSDDVDDATSSSSGLTRSSVSSSSSTLPSPQHSSSEDDDENENKTETVLTDDEIWLEKHTSVLSLPKWKSVQQIWKRELGCFHRAWEQKVCGSTAMVRRLEQQFTLDAHEGCVNALHFNQTGTLLASGSDDLDIHIWDWVSASQEPFISYNSGHRSNVFQAKFMPNSSDLTVVSAARDGQVRVGYLSSTGSCRDTKKLAQHRGSAHKLALDSSGCKSTFLSCGEDSVVMGFDLRENKPSRKLVTVKHEDKKIPLYSIDTSPHLPQQFTVSGRDQWARVYDRRMLDPDSPETVAEYCPHHLMNATDLKANITCSVYNYDGSELLCSYNDEDIYLFNTNHSSGDDFAKKYKGHRNNATVKGVNFYGPRSEFVVSGSDCGNIFLWDKSSSKVVQFMQGDDGGVVNVLEPHPNLPLLATSGLDKNIKIWGPTGDGSLNEDKLKELMLTNRKERHSESNEGHVIDSHLLWFLMRSLRNASGRRRHRREDRDDNDEDSSDSSSHDSSEDSDRESRGRRSRTDCLTS